jgi:hypothetical protein
VVRFSPSPFPFSVINPFVAQETLFDEDGEEREVNIDDTSVENQKDGNPRT